MNHVLIPLMDDGIPRDTYNAFLKWFGEPSAWVEKLEMLKPVATRKYVECSRMFHDILDSSMDLLELIHAVISY